MTQAILQAHGIRLFGHKYHPYFMAADLATLACVAFMAVFTSIFPILRFGTSIAIYFAIVLLYQAFLRIKSRLFRIHSRSFLQDSLLFLLPTYALIHWIVGNSLPAALDLVGLILPLYAGFVRIGCFFGGCCYGVPSRYGVDYPAQIFEAQTGCRKFSPGPPPAGRVFPVQLAESFFQFALFAVLLKWECSRVEPSSLILPAYLLGYSVVRFFLDFARQASARPRIGKLSEAQVVCLFTAASMVALLLWVSYRKEVP